MHGLCRHRIVPQSPMLSQLPVLLRQSIFRQTSRISKESGSKGLGFGLTLKGFTINHFKSEIRISKIETNPNIKFLNVQNTENFDHYNQYRYYDVFKYSK